MKIYWKLVPYTSEPGPEPTNVHRVEVPVETLLEVRSQLERTSKIIPPHHQRRGSWRAGLMHRFESGDAPYRNQQFVFDKKVSGIRHQM
jgi:hypothetical protein